MTPPYLGLEARYRVGEEMADRLIAHLELTGGKRGTQQRLHGAAFLDPTPHVVLENCKTTAAGCFGGIHRQIGVFEKLIAGYLAFRHQRHADAGAYLDPIAVDPERFGQRRDQALGEYACRVAL